MRLWPNRMNCVTLPQTTVPMHDAVCTRGVDEGEMYEGGMLKLPVMR